MKKAFLHLSLVSLLLTFLPVVNASNSVSRKEFVREVPAEKETSVEFASNLLYDSLKLNRIGLSRQAMLYAYKGYQQLVKKGLINKGAVLSVCDFSQPSQKKRLYVIDIKSFKVLMNTYVAHGKRSGLHYASKFSNRTESHQSSLGFYITKGTYFGKHGLSLRLTGVDKGYNHNAEKRAIVVHGARYIGESRSDAAYMGRSFGCPAVPQAEASKVINMIKDGTCLFIYHPSKSYLHGSSILNG